MTQFNITCPAPTLLPTLDAAYHECNKAFANGSCDRFVDTFAKLTPEYDCQRAFDAAAGKNYIVPAIWLAGDGALEDYVALLAKLASRKNKLFSGHWFDRASADARRIFAAKAFQRVLDGHLAEEYGPLSKRLEKELK
jgi:hypothetical protein